MGRHYVVSVVERDVSCCARENKSPASILTPASALTAVNRTKSCLWPNKQFLLIHNRLHNHQSCSSSSYDDSVLASEDSHQSVIWVFTHHILTPRGKPRQDPRHATSNSTANSTASHGNPRGKSHGEPPQTRHPATSSMTKKKNSSTRAITIYD